MTGTLREMLGTIASTMSLNLRVVRAELSRSARRHPDPALTSQGLLDLLVRAAERRKLFGRYAVNLLAFQRCGPVRRAVSY